MYTRNISAFRGIDRFDDSEQDVAELPETYNKIIFNIHIRRLYVKDNQ